MELDIHFWSRGQETEKLTQLFIQHWHDSTIIAHGTIYHPEDLEALFLFEMN